LIGGLAGEPTQEPGKEDGLEPSAEGSGGRSWHGTGRSGPDQTGGDGAVVGWPIPVGLPGDDRGVGDFGGTAVEDPVDAFGLALERTEAGEGIGIFIGTGLGSVPGIGETAFLHEDLIGATVAGEGIEIADKDQGFSGVDLADTVDDEGGGLLACGFDLMIEMGVPEVEGLAGGPILELGRGEHAFVGMSPGG